jgi:DNA polymerase I-like protein with 3'-5' exonuclease and polymerase domains
MFFDDEPLTLRKHAALRAPPPIPETGWRPPTEFPNLSGAAMLSADVETWEPDFDHGPGWGRGKDKGHIVGVSIGAVDELGNRGKWYFPVRHTIEPETNLHAPNVFDWLRDTLQTPHVPKVFANGMYDIGWLTQENIYVEGELHDVQFAEPLLCETGFVDLEYLGQKYLGKGKETSALYGWLAEAYGGSVSSAQRANIYRAPARLVGPYAESDADLPLQIIVKQRPLLEAEGLWPVYRMECALIRLLTRMRLRGVRVDIPRAEQLYGELGNDIRERYKKLGHDFNCNIDSVGSSTQLAKIFDAAGIKYPVTQKTGKPSFKKEYLKNLEHPLGDAINDIREREKLHGTFLYACILNRNSAGRVHCSFDPLRGDDGGTRSGRFSSSDPNLQNIPVRTKLGKLIREIFVPDTGHVAIEKDDYSQIEYRFLGHFAVGGGSDGVREAYASNPKTDYHEHVQQEIKVQTGQLIERKPIKNINFGLLYGMGVDKLARMLGISKKLAMRVLTAYHNGAPYVKATMDAAAAQAQEHGFIRTILGRKSRFDLWEPMDIDYQDRAIALPKEHAINLHGSMIQRSHTHKAINRQLQGSSADMMKLAMVKCDEMGLYEYTGVPLLTVHDELVFSVADESPEVTEAFAEMRRVMETCLPLRVPVSVSSDRALNWGLCG